MVSENINEIPCGFDKSEKNSALGMLVVKCDFICSQIKFYSLACMDRQERN